MSMPRPPSFRKPVRIRQFPLATVIPDRFRAQQPGSVHAIAISGCEDVTREQERSLQRREVTAGWELFCKHSLNCQRPMTNGESPTRYQKRLVDQPPEGKPRIAARARLVSQAPNGKPARVDQNLKCSSRERHRRSWVKVKRIWSFSSESTTRKARFWCLCT